MSDLLFLVLTVWFLGSCAGTAIAILLVRGGTSRPAPVPERLPQAPANPRQRVA